MKIRNIRSSRILALTAAVLASTLVLTACASDEFADKWGSGSDANYISGDGSVAEFAPDARKTPATFEGELDTGGSFESAELLGDVAVINFWYAGCPPCRVEAADLEATYQLFQDDDVKFLGVNVRDTAETALGFADSYQISYPSILDIETGSAQLAFAGVVPPNAVPTTLVLDRQGRVSARILGIIDPGTLKALIQTVLDEGSDSA